MRGHSQAREQSNTALQATAVGVIYSETCLSSVSSSGQLRRRALTSGTSSLWWAGKKASRELTPFAVRRFHLLRKKRTLKQVAACLCDSILHEYSGSFECLE